MIVFLVFPTYLPHTYHLKFKVIVQVGYKVFVDIDYELSVNTLGGKNFLSAGKISCNDDITKTFDDLLYENANKELEEKYGCSIPFLPQSKSMATGEILDICKSAETGQLALGTYKDLETKMLGNVPCTRMDVSLGMPHVSHDAATPQGSIPYQGYGSDDTAFVLFYFKPTIKVKSTVLEYDFVTLVAEIGGYVGLFIGISLAESSISIISFLERQKRGKAM